MKYTILFTMTLLVSVTLHAQNFSDPTTLNDSRTMDAFTKLRNRVTKSALTSQDVKGSTYFNEKFMLSEVDYFGKTMEDKTYLRYNAFSDEIEMGTYADQKTTEEILLKNNKIISRIGSETYKYLPYKPKEGNITKIGYLIVLHESDNYSLYLKKTKVYMEATAARTSLERSFPARFIDEITFYFNYQGNTLQELRTNKRGFIEAFSAHQENIKSYLKANKIRSKSTEDIANMFVSINAVL